MKLTPTHLRLAGREMTIHTPLSPRVRAGREYPLTGHPDTRTHVLDVDRGPLALENHRREGFRTPVAFADHFMRSFDPGFPPTQPCPGCDGDGTIDCIACWEDNVRVHALDAHLCGQCRGSGRVPAPISHALVLHRFGALHAGADVWIVTFKLVAAPIFLARPAPGRNGDYTHNRARAIDDLEPVRVEDLRPRWQADADARHAATRDPRTHSARVARSLRAL